jgi:hypothetical protein
MSSIGIMGLVQLAIGLIIPLLAIICGIVCAVYRRLSSWLTLVALGFFGEAVLGIADRLFNLLFFQVIEASEMPVRDVLLVYHLSSTLGHVLAVFLLTLGIILALGDISRRMSRPRDMAVDARDRPPALEAREAWQPRQEGSQDIQR